MTEELERAIYRAIGKASLCWDEQPKGKFDSTRAVAIADELLEEVKHHIDAQKEQRDGRQTENEHPEGYEAGSQ